MSKISQEQQMEIANKILCTVEHEVDDGSQSVQRFKFNSTNSEDSVLVQQSKQQHQFIHQHPSGAPNTWPKNTDLLSKIDNNGQYKADSAFRQHDRKGDKVKQRQYALYYLNNNPSMKHLKDCQYYDYQQATLSQGSKYYCNCNSQYMFSSILLHTQNNQNKHNKYNRRNHTSDSICSSAKNERNQSKPWFADAPSVLGVVNKTNHKKYSNMRYLFNKINQINSNHKHKVSIQQQQPYQKPQSCLPTQLNSDNNSDIYIVNNYVKGKRLKVTSSHLSRCTMSGPVTAHAFSTNTQKQYIDGKNFRPNRYNFTICNKLYNFNGTAGKSRSNSNQRDSRNKTNIIYISHEQSARQQEQPIINIQSQAKSKEKAQHDELAISHLIKSGISVKQSNKKTRIKNIRHKDVNQQSKGLDQQQKQKQKVRELKLIQKQLAYKYKIIKYYEGTFASTFRYLKPGENYVNTHNNIVYKDIRSGHRSNTSNQQTQKKGEKKENIRVQKRKRDNNMTPSSILNQIINQNINCSNFDNKKKVYSPQTISKSNTMDQSKIKNKHLDKLQIGTKFNCIQLKKSNRLTKSIK